MQKTFGIGTVSHDSYRKSPALHVDGQVAFLSDLANGDDRLSKATVRDLMPDWDHVVDLCERAAEQIRAGGSPVKLHGVDEVTIHAPIDPPQVFCTGANYHTHVVQIIVDRFSQESRDKGLSEEQIRANAEEMMRRRAEKGLPYIFSRISSSYAGPFDDLVLPSYAKEPDWEAELALVFKTGGRRIPEGDVMSHVAGYMTVNDITSRDQIFTADPPDLGADWLHAKNSPGFFPMGPWIVPARLVPDPHDLPIKLWLNGDLMQDGTTGDMIFDIPRQVSVLSGYVRLLAGDVLATGSPAGNGTHYNRFLRD